ncbi:MAG TPA: hypothetical protein VNQ77_11645 [Frankiaceae bacterium]|nr:hypothetical protein [Frankiaceae bacterium]
MRRFVLATLMLCLVGSALPARAANAKPTGTITITAPRHARLTVTLPASVTFWLEDEGGVDGPIFAGGGKHAGFVLLPASKRAEATGVVRVPAAEFTSTELLAGDDPTPTMPSGRYTLEVVADRPVEIRVRVRGMASRRWNATVPLSVRTAGGTFTDDVGREVSGAGKITLSESSVVFTVMMFRATGTSVSAAWCVARQAGCGGASVVQESRVMSSRPLVEQTTGAGFYLPPRALPAGAWTTQWTVGADVLVREPTAYALVVG